MRSISSNGIGALMFAGRIVAGAYKGLSPESEHPSKNTRLPFGMLGVGPFDPVVALQRFNSLKNTNALLEKCGGGYLWSTLRCHPVRPGRRRVIASTTRVPPVGG